MELSCCSTSSYVSVQAQLPSLSQVPCFCQGEGEGPSEILDLAHGLPVVPTALLNLVKRRKKPGMDRSSILALAIEVTLKEVFGS